MVPVGPAVQVSGGDVLTPAQVLVATNIAPSVRAVLVRVMVIGAASGLASPPPPSLPPAPVPPAEPPAPVPPSLPPVPPPSVAAPPAPLASGIGLLSDEQPAPPKAMARVVDKANASRRGFMRSVLR